MTPTFFSALIPVLLGASLVAQAPLSPVQLTELQAVTSIAASPDGNIAAFIRSVPRLADDAPGPNYQNLYLIGETGATEHLLLGGKRRVPGVVFDPTGKWLSFLDKDKSTGNTEVFGFRVDELRKDGAITATSSPASPHQITKTERGVGSYRWSPDGKKIAFTLTDRTPAGRASAQKAGFRAKVKDEDYAHLSLWLHDIAEQSSKRITKDMSVFSFEWNPRGRYIAAGIAPNNLTDDHYMFQRIHLIDTEAGTVKKWVDNPGKLGDMAWSPDGTRLAYVGALDARDPHAGNLFILKLGSTAQALYTHDFKGMIHQISWLTIMKKLRVIALISEGMKTKMVSIDAQTGDQKIFLDKMGVAFRSYAQGSGNFYVPGSSANHPEDVYVVQTEPAKADHYYGIRRITRTNTWLNDVNLGRQQTVRFKSVADIEIEGNLIYPVDYDSDTRYPLVIIAHGGPESHYSEGWNSRYSEPGQVLAGMGYFVWYPNYRSSTGRGTTFAKLDHGDPMGNEFEDHIQAIRHFSELGMIDKARVGIMGGSYGGYTAAWAATKKSEHFAAAVSFVPFTDIRTKWLTTDIPWEFYLVHYEEKFPHQQVAFLAERSPLTYAQDCKTPLLLLGGTSDPRVHPSQPFMLYRAVKFATKTPCRYVQYPGEGHGNRINTNRFDYLVRSTRWLNYYLKPGDQRMATPPAIDLDYKAWMATKHEDLETYVRGAEKK